MYCINCGKKFGEEDKFCSVCGSKRNSIKDTIDDREQITNLFDNTIKKTTEVSTEIKNSVVESVSNVDKEKIGTKNSISKFYFRHRLGCTSLVIALLMVFIGSFIVPKVSGYVSRSTPERTLNEYFKTLNEYDYTGLITYCNVFTASEIYDFVEAALDWKSDAKENKTQFELIEMKEIRDIFNMEGIDPYSTTGMLWQL